METYDLLHTHMEKVPANKTKAFSMKLKGETVSSEKSLSNVCSSGKNLDIVWFFFN